MTLAIMSRPEGFPMAAEKPFKIEPVLVVSAPADELQVEIIGGVVPFCRPARLPRLPSEEFIVAVASLWISEGRIDRGRAMLASLQRALGVTPEDHIAAVEMAFAADRTARAARRPSTTGPLRVEIPDGERGRSADELRLLDEINARLAKPPARRNGMTPDKAREADLKARAALERAPRDKAEQGEVKGGIEETARLAEGRGEDTQRSPSGRLEIISHDPLRRLLSSGKLSTDQHEAGEALRDCYEARSGDAGSQLANLVQATSGHDNHKFVANRYERALATERAQAVELAVLTGMFRLKDGSMLRIEAFGAYKAEGAPPPHVALSVLRGICAHNIGLTEQGRGRAFERNSKALLIALDITHECLMGSRAKRA